jgi:hypothetical protein
MRMHAVLPMFFALSIGIAVLPAAAYELEQKAASHRTVTAFLTQHGRATPSTFPRPVACKADGSACAADAECCSGACKPIGEGRSCVSNK